MTPTKEQIARHEAAHFVTAWALGCPDYYVNIVPEEQKQGQGGYSDGSKPDGNFDEIISILAGVVADGWGKSNEGIVEYESQWVRAEGADWTRIICTLAYSGIDAESPTALNTAMSWCLDAVRAILTECKNEWQEVEDYLIRHGRIGFNGEHPDGGEEATFRFFYHWGEIYEKVQPLVERLRSEFYEFAHDTIHEPIYEHK